MPGGARESGEALEDTLKREIREEIGIEVKSFELFGVYSGQNLYYRYPNVAEVFNVSIVYLTRGLEGVIQVNPEEHREYQYFEIRHLPDEISPPIKSILKDLQTRI